MGERGPAKTPAALRVMKGNTGKESKAVFEGTNEPKPIPGAPICPEWLPELAQQYYAAVVEALGTIPGLLTVADGDILTSYALACYRLRQAEDDILKNGMITQTGTDDKPGFRIANPAVSISARSRLDMARLGGLLGLSPAARSRIQVIPTAPEEDDLEKILSTKPTLTVVPVEEEEPIEKTSDRIFNDSNDTNV